MSFLLQYSPDKLGHGADKEEIEKAMQLYLKLQEAWKILNDPEKKRRYDAELAGNFTSWSFTLQFYSILSRSLSGGF